MTKMAPKKRLMLRELKDIAKKLKDADLDIAQEVVFKEARTEQHTYLSRTERPYGVT